MQSLVCENLSDQLVDMIGRQIIRNELKSGEILTENKISKEWEVSVAPVKIAFRILERKKLVKKPLRGSYRVTALTAEFADQLYAASDQLYRYTLLQAAKRVQSEEAACFYAKLKKMEQSAERNDFESYIKEMGALMEKVLGIAQNKIIGDFLNDLIPSIERIQFAVIGVKPSFARKSLNHLRDCYCCLLNKAPEKAVNSYLEFSNISREILLDHLTPGKKDAPLSIEMLNNRKFSPTANGGYRKFN